MPKRFLRRRSEKEHLANVILIVEDDPKSLKLTRDLLRASGYTTIEATDGEQGVKLAKAEKPGLILMDIMMPRMDGLQACHQIKTGQTTKAIPVVMLTAVDYMLNKKLAIQIMGANGYITKPFTPQELLDMISRFLPPS